MMDMTRCGPPRDEFTMRQTNQGSVCWPRSIVDGRRRRPEGARANVVNQGEFRSEFLGRRALVRPRAAVRATPGRSAQSKLRRRDWNTAASSSAGGAISRGCTWEVGSSRQRGGGELRPLLHTCTAVV